MTEDRVGAARLLDREGFLPIRRAPRLPGVSGA